MTTSDLILVLGGNGKTGSRVVERLQARNLDVRIGSRSAEPPFDWVDSTTWPAVLEGVRSVYITFQPDVAVPASTEIMKAFTDLAVSSGVQRLVMLSGRGEEEALRCEEVVRNAGVEWTIVRASWFAQNFSEGFMLDSILSGELALPAGDIKEPFIDVEDIADIVTAALTEDRHVGQVYDVTGPRLLTFAEIAAEIAAASGREVRFVQVPADAYKQALEDAELPEVIVWLVNYLFTTVLDGRNEMVTQDVQRALGRPARDFSDYARRTAATGVWDAVPTEG